MPAPSPVITADGQFRGGKEMPLKPAVDEALAMGGCDSIKNVIVYKRTGSESTWNAPRDIWWHDLDAGPGRRLRADLGQRRAPAVHPLHLRLDRQAEGRAALHRRLPAGRHPDA